jgi:hypothetical protein
VVDLGIVLPDTAKDPSNNVPDVAAQVSAVGSTTEGPGRDQAVQALREYKDAKGDVELGDHL